MAKKPANPVPAVPTTLNVANWLVRIAYMSSEYLQPMKLHRLLYLSQGHYGALNGGRALMPAHFMATREGPIEPNLYQFMSNGMPTLDPPPQAPPEEIQRFLEVIWRKYGHHSADHLLRLIGRDEGFFTLLENAPRGLIPQKVLTRDFRHGPERGRIEQPKQYTQTGKVMTDWAITKRGDEKKVINPALPEPERARTAAEDLAISLIANSQKTDTAKFVDLNETGGKAPSFDAGPAVQERTAIAALADDIAKKEGGKPKISIEDAADAEALALRILGDMEQNASPPPQPKKTAAWRPKKADRSLRVLRSTGGKSSAPSGGLPWRGND